MPLSLSHHPRSFCGSVPLIMSPAARRDDHSAHAVLIFFFLSACDFFASSLSKKGDLELRAGAEEWRERERRLIQLAQANPVMDKSVTALESFRIKERPLLAENAPRAPATNRTCIEKPETGAARGDQRLTQTRAPGNYSN